MTEDGHSHSHAHGHAHGGAPGSPRIRLLLAACTVPFLVAALAGLALLWPRHYVGGTAALPGTITAEEVVPCQNTGCLQMTVRMEGGPDAGTTVVLAPAPVPIDSPGLRTGNGIIVKLTTAEDGSKRYEWAGFRSDPMTATVQEVRAQPCEIGRCVDIAVLLADGPDAGRKVDLPRWALTEGQRAPTVGDRVVVARTTNPADGTTIYNFSDYERSSPLLLLAGLFVVATIAVGRRSGLGGLVGLGASYLLIVSFALPAILDGRNPMAVALVAGTLIMFLVLYLASGVNVRITTALLGTLLSIGLTAALAQVFVAVTRLSGLTSDEAAFLHVDNAAISLDGVLLASIVIGTLGALNDVTVTQAAAVWEVHRANPDQSRRHLYLAGMRVGRDHIASTIDTLVLAYAGASLPLLLLFSQQNLAFGRVVTGEIVAEEVVRTLVGSLGLIASVPITTFVAALVVSADHEHRRSAARDRSAAPNPSPRAAADDGPESSEPAATEPAVTAPAPNRERRRDRPRPGRSERPAAEPEKPEKPWRPPKAERDFWGDA